MHRHPAAAADARSPWPASPSVCILEKTVVNIYAPVTGEYEVENGWKAVDVTGCFRGGDGRVGAHRVGADLDERLFRMQ